MLSDPRLGRMTRDPEMNHTTRSHLDAEKKGERSEEQIDHRQQVTGPDILSMVLQAHGPSLTSWGACPDRPHVFLEGALGDAEAELEELALNALGSPEQVLLRQPLDELNGFWRELGLWTLGSRCVFLEEAQARARPAQEGVRLEDHEGSFPVRDAARHDEEAEAIAAIEVRMFDLALKDDALLAQPGIFEDQLASGTSEVGEGIEEEGGRSGRSGPAPEERIEE